MSFREFKRRLRYLARGDKSLPGVQLDGVRVIKKNTDFLLDPRFVEAWEFAEQGNKAAWAKHGAVPDIRWRAHVCCWAASNAIMLDGDFAEFGVNAGLLSMSVCQYLGFEKSNKTFWLFDTFEGIPTGDLKGENKATAEARNKAFYSDVFEIAAQNFSSFHNAKLVKGSLPDTIDTVPIEKIAYLSIDLNSELYERLSIEKVWNRVVTGAYIVLDDYAFASHRDQYDMWNSFAAEHNQSILTLPTGQGLLIKR